MNARHCLLFVILSLASPAIAKTPKSVAIEFDPGIAENINVKTAWLSYAGYLAKWAVAAEHAKYVCNRHKPLPFDAELYARRLLITDAWTKLKANDAQAVDEYLVYSKICTSTVAFSTPAVQCCRPSDSPSHPGSFQTVP